MTSFVSGRNGFAIIHWRAFFLGGRQFIIHESDLEESLQKGQTRIEHELCMIFGDGFLQLTTLYMYDLSTHDQSTYSIIYTCICTFFSFIILVYVHFSHLLHTVCTLFFIYCIWYVRIFFLTFSVLYEWYLPLNLSDVLFPKLSKEGLQRSSYIFHRSFNQWIILNHFSIEDWLPHCEGNHPVC